MSLLTVTDIYRKHGDTVVVDKVSFVQERGQKIAIAGETGSGKTTLMRIVAGLGQADSGIVTFEGKQVKGIYDKLMPGHKGIAYLSQHFELNNNYRVEELLAYANNLTDADSEKLYALCRIDHLQKRLTNTLSGGEKQRVALAKLLTHTPRLLLLDEPFSNMDLIHKNILKSVVDDIGDRLGVTCMLISHDADDMLPWADEILVMKDGIIVQHGMPEEIYQRPVSAYVAGLFGKYNLLAPELVKLFEVKPDSSIYVRPESFMISRERISELEGRVDKVSYFGGHYELLLMVKDQQLITKSDASVRTGDAVYVALTNP